MVTSFSIKDLDIPFPHLTLLKASAGSGKTHALTKRFVQFILSDKIPHHHLRNILAITFSNNAAKEMKERILLWLKEIYFNNPDKLHQLYPILSINEDQLVNRAESLIEEILLNYTDFQVKTIDSFMTSIYKASAIDLGYSPDFDILMAPDAIMAYAFNRFLRRVRAGSPEARFLEELLDLILERKDTEAAYLWDPSKGLLDEIQELYNKLSNIVKEVRIPDEFENSDFLKGEIRDLAEKLNKLIEKSSLQRNKNSTFETILEAIRNGSYPDLIGKGLKNLPVLKPKNAEAHSWYQRISESWSELSKRIKGYTQQYAFSYYIPYLKAYESFKDILERMKREEGIIFIDDINKKLSDYLDREIIPDVYFRIGETIYHYLIDEFQDTSPLQWNNLFPLIENSLAQGGSFFAVGDTKQAIYGFRNADYRIMRRLESENPFSSAHHDVEELKVNYRSLEGILEFNKEFFQKVVTAHEEYDEAAGQSGLTDYEQKVKEGHEGSGYVELVLCEKNDEEPIEKAKLQTLIQELRKRGYRYSDIAILAFENEDVVNLTAWLNEMDVPFISYSSLDIRTRKLTEEIFFLLTFLDSPPDDLSFAGFLLGDVFRRILERRGRSVELERFHEFLFRNRKRTPLYKQFQEEFAGLWEDYFDRLFRSTGYLPLYDLVSEIYQVFAIFETFKEEEATLIKILEVIKNFERKGANNPKDFLRMASDEESTESDWNIDVPAGMSAVRVMTIHKAKGLQFPVAILLLYEEPSHGFKYIFHEKQEEVYLLKINQKIAEASPLLKEAYEEERLKEIVNRLNTLYVGFTRPEAELYVIGVFGQRSQFPMNLLRESGYALGVGSSRPAIKNLPVYSSEEILQTQLQLQHPSFQVYPFDGAQAQTLGAGRKSALRVDFSPSVVEELKLEERQRGEFIHRVLYFLDDLEGEVESRLEEVIRQVKSESNIDYPIDAMKKGLLEFLSHDEIRPYFSPQSGRVIRREQDYSDSEGNLLRMDRVIIDEDRIMVIDYKTGSEKKEEERHCLQLKNYLRILRDLYPDKVVKGMIAYVDLKEVVRSN
jgi:ATP-dependent exoDNAse (exonuclease V) beta subunit